MLKTRIITACALFAGLLAAVFLLPHRGWLILCALLGGAAAWEWGGLMRWGQVARIVFVLAMLALCALCIRDSSIYRYFPDMAKLSLARKFFAIEIAGRPVVFSFKHIMYGFMLLFWLVLIPCWLHYKWRLRGVAAAAVGLIVLVPPTVAMTDLGGVRPWGLLGALAVAWVADIAAYFSGRAWGRHKLAPAISPGKTWEGALGAVIAVMVYGVLWLHGLVGSGLVATLAFLAVLTVASILGDLFESLLKRQAGVKDSGSLLPGHGGILDRVDSQTATLPLIVFGLFYL
ncbi:MAG: phosphatidate cytidylyltransferase [Azoarcus sp.]|jgi:phosphatidate cytidylyltransferase|nr:phosphatidate cytidylyltransferase [Azoarcus sp.]